MSCTEVMDSKPFSEAPERFPFDEASNFDSHLDRLVQQHPDLAEPLKQWREDGTSKKTKLDSFKRQQEEEEKREEPSPLSTNLRNTVPNMQQRKEEEDRSQRSQSAPPVGNDFGRPMQNASYTENVSNTNIPPAREPVVRHIPIFVEGRDEPVLPKDVVDSGRRSPRPNTEIPHHHNTMNQSHQDWSQLPSHQHPSMERPLYVPNAGQQPIYSEYGSVNIPIHYGNTPSQQSSQPAPPANNQNRPRTSSTGERTIPVNVVPPTTQEQPSKSTPPPPPPHQQQQLPPKPAKVEPLDRVKAVQDDVVNLQKQIDQFTGANRKDKEFIYLDEMLTRNLLKLDDIETAGNEELRTARREAIRTIQRCISQLESKVPSQVDQSQSPTSTESGQTANTDRSVEDLSNDKSRIASNQYSNLQPSSPQPPGTDQIPPPS